MQSLLNFFRAASPLKKDKLEKSKQTKPPAIKAKLEARIKRTHNAQELASKQKRAALRRSEILNRFYLRLQQHKDHGNAVRQRKADSNTYFALRSVRADRKLFAATSRRSNALQLRQKNAKQHNLDVAKKSFQASLQSDYQKDDLLRKIESRQKVASQTRGAHLLSVRQHQAVVGQRVPFRQPISFEIEVRHKSAGCPDIAKRLQQVERREITLDQITQKLTQASILRMRLQAERYAKAKNVSIKVSKVRVNRNFLDRVQVLNSVFIDRKQRAAKVAHQKQVLTRQKKAFSHNEYVTNRQNRATCKFESSLESKMERLHNKIRKAAANRGNQLLLIKQTAEKLQKPRVTDSTPISFEIEVEKTSSNKDNPVKQRLESREVQSKTIEEIVEKLALAQLRRNQKREQTRKRQKRGCRRVGRDRQDNLWVQLNYKLTAAANQRNNQLSAIQVKAKLHNELVQSRSTAAAINYQSQKLRKFSDMQEKMRLAAQKRESKRPKNSGSYQNVA